MTYSGTAQSADLEVAGVQVSADCWSPENWLTYRGDHRESIGLLMGPGYRTLGQPRALAYSTVVAAVYELGTVCDCSALLDDGGGHLSTDCPGRGRTRLGLVSGDQRAELGYQIAARHDDVWTVLATQRASTKGPTP